MRSRVPVFHSCRGRALSFRWVPRQRMPQAKHGCWVVSMKLSYPVLGTSFACNTRTVVPWSTLGKWCLGIFLETGIKEIMSRRLKPVMGHLPLPLQELHLTVLARLIRRFSWVSQLQWLPLPLASPSSISAWESAAHAGWTSSHRAKFVHLHMAFSHLHFPCSFLCLGLVTAIKR